jgi:predicted DNA-binding protein (MmcQ/YjbR family)
MSRETVNHFCATLAGANVSSPFGPGHEVWKVGNKIFAIMGHLDEGVSVKCRDIEASEMLIEMGVGKKAPYLHRSWILLPWGAMPDDEIEARIRASYTIIRNALPKKVQAGLG